MRLKILFIVLTITTATLINGCKNGSDPSEPRTSLKDIAKARQDEVNSKKVEELKNQYPKIPDERILDNGPGTALYAELKKRYKDDAASLKQQVEASGAKLYFVVLTVES